MLKCNSCGTELMSFMKYCYQCGEAVIEARQDYLKAELNSLSEYILSISKLYLNARDTVCTHERIFRGESHGISSQSEDLFALLLTSYLKEESLYVNQQLSVVNELGKLTSTVKPDVVVMKDEVVSDFIDLKMDLGYNRKKFADFCIQKNELMRKIHDQQFRTKNGKTKEVIVGKINGTCKYHIPVVTDCNIDKSNLENIIATTEALECVEIYFLTSGKHLNNYDSDMLVGVQVNHKEFERLIKNLIT